MKEITDKLASELVEKLDKLEGVLRKWEAVTFDAIRYSHEDQWAKLLEAINATDSALNPKLCAPCTCPSSDACTYAQRCLVNDPMPGDPDLDEMAEALRQGKG